MRDRRWARLWPALALMGCLAQAVLAETELANLAQGKRVASTSAQDENPDANAVDGDLGTRWCAGDETVPQKLRIDLGTTTDVGGIAIRWESAEGHYKYLVEGAPDTANYVTLSDQQDNSETGEWHRLLVNGKGVRYVRITVTGTDAGAWASLWEVRIHAADEMKKLTADELKAWWATADPDIAAGKATSSSSDEDGHPSRDAVDGNAETRWCANGADVPAWWQVDLGKPSDLSGLALTWEKADTNYKWKVEGSADGKEWRMLSDQTATESTRQTQKVKFAGKGLQHVRVTVTAAPEGCWPSLFEVQVFGK